MMLEVILSELPRLSTLEAVADCPGTDGARVSVAGLLCSWARLASCIFTPLLIPPARLARVLWPTLLDQCVSGLSSGTVCMQRTRWQLGGTCPRSRRSVLLCTVSWPTLPAVKGQIKFRHTPAFSALSLKGWIAVR